MIRLPSKPEGQQVYPAMDIRSSRVFRNEGSLDMETPSSEALHRKLRSREVQLFAVGGAIGTCNSISTPGMEDADYLRSTVRPDGGCPSAWWSGGFIHWLCGIRDYNSSSQSVLRLVAFEEVNAELYLTFVIGEIVCYRPIPSPFIRLAGHWVDESLSFAMGWNFFLNVGMYVAYCEEQIRSI